MKRTLVLAALLLGLVGCGSEAGGGGRLQVVATTAVAADLARAVAGDDADVHSLVPPGADPHGYELRPRDAETLASADVVVRSGGELDAWLADAIDAAGAEAEVVTLMDHVHTLADDPHWWHDPRNARSAVDALGRALAAADRDGVYESRARVFGGRLDALDRAIGRCVDGLASSRRKLVTTHDALGYFADRYGFEVIGTVIPSLSTQGQPSGGDLARLIADIRRAGVRTIFPEASVSPKVEQAVAREAGVRVGGELHADTLPEGVSYLQAMAANARTIVEGLGGSCGVEA